MGIKPPHALRDVAGAQLQRDTEEAQPKASLGDNLEPRGAF